jgi:hypothetical protein
MFERQQSEVERPPKQQSPNDRFWPTALIADASIKLPLGMN